MTDSAQEKLALVIPTLNEAGNLPTLFSRIQKTLDPLQIDYELIVVDDGSSDGTADVAREFAHGDQRIRVFVRKGQRGLAGAVIHGWSHTDATLLGAIDADLQHPPEVLPLLLKPVLNGNDIAIASRYINGNADSISEWNKFRAFVSRCSTLVTSPFLQRRHLHVKDPLSGFFIVRRGCIDDLQLQPEGFKILLEILVKGNIHKPIEVPFHFATRKSGKSKADFKVAFHYFSLLGKLSRYALFGPGQQ
jgi:dolichol-phosphate mannosyltransferase